MTEAAMVIGRSAPVSGSSGEGAEGESGRVLGGPIAVWDEPSASGGGWALSGKW